MKLNKKPLGEKAKNGIYVIKSPSGQSYGLWKIWYGKIFDYPEGRTFNYLPMDWIKEWKLIEEL